MFWATGGHRASVQLGRVSSGRPPPPDGEVRLGPQYASESGGRARHAANHSLCSPASGLGQSPPQQEATGALRAAQEDPGQGWPESQCDSHSGFSGQRSRRQPSYSPPGKRKSGREIRPRSYTQNLLSFFQELFLCLIHIESHKAVLVLLSMCSPSQFALGFACQK